MGGEHGRDRLPSTHFAPTGSAAIARFGSATASCRSRWNPAAGRRVDGPRIDAGDLSPRSPFWMPVQHMIRQRSSGKPVLLTGLPRVFSVGRRQACRLNDVPQDPGVGQHAQAAGNLLVRSSTRSLRHGHAQSGGWASGGTDGPVHGIELIASQHFHVFFAPQGKRSREPRAVFPPQCSDTRIASGPPGSPRTVNATPAIIMTDPSTNGTPTCSPRIAHPSTVPTKG